MPCTSAAASDGWACSHGVAPKGARGPSDEVVHVAGLYWHFVDVVWILLYPALYLVSRHS